ncbi:MAG TPA: IS30 family transposase [Steroidobacteraceae bacterium]
MTGRPSVVTARQREELWRRYKAGETILGIGRALGQRTTNLYRVLQASGGMAPAERTRSPRVLSFCEREEISRGIAAGAAYRAIARSLKRAVSTVSQEVARHGGRGCYRAAEADRAAWESARRPKPCLLVRNRQLQRIVAARLKQDWSPQQIAGWLRDQHPGNPEMRVSHETIYRSLFVQARGALKKELLGHLRSKRRIRRPRHAIDGRQGERIIDAVSIRQRPAAVEDRAVPGHWEGDLVEGSRGTFIATLVERQSRFVILVKLPDKRTEAVVGALIKAVRKLPTALRKSLTWDRGSELADHAKFTVATDVKVYFCDPYSPWQRGSNENTNGLLRQYYPKGMDLSGVTQFQLDVVARKLNTRPRETLDWQTPAYILETSVSMTH